MAITGGITLLQKLQKLYGARAVTDRLGRTTNVQTLAQGTNNPFAQTFSRKYLKKNPDGVEEASKVIMENMQFAFGNKNTQQMKNFEYNVNTLYDMKFPPAKAEAEILDLSTKKQVTGKGIDSLKDKMGLPEGVSPDSPMGKILIQQKQMDKVFSDAGTTLEGAAKTYSTGIEARRRAAMRQILLRDKRINLTPEEIDSLKDMKDLQKNADPNMDPMVLLNKYYKRDNKKLEILDEVIDESMRPTDAADNFLAKDDKLELADKDLGDKLKDYDGDPDAMAQGGRAGFKYGGSFKQYVNRENKYKDLNFEEWLREDKALGGIAGQLHLNRTGYDMGGAAGTELAITQSLKDFEKYKKAGGKLNYKKFIASGKEGVSRFFNQGGRVGFANGGDVERFKRALYAANEVDEATGNRLYGGNIENLFSQYKANPSNFFYAGDDTQGMYDRFNASFNAPTTQTNGIADLLKQSVPFGDATFKLGSLLSPVATFLTGGKFAPRTPGMDKRLQEIITQQMRDSGKLSGTIGYEDYSQTQGEGTAFPNMTAMLKDLVAGKMTAEDFGNMGQLGRLSYTVDPSTGKASFGSNVYDFDPTNVAKDPSDNPAEQLFSYLGRRANENEVAINPNVTISGFGNNQANTLDPRMLGAQDKGLDARMGRTYEENVQAMADPRMRAAYGGRIGLEKGGPPNPGRRNFMKLMAGLASLPVVGKLFKGAKVADKIVQLKNTTTSMPAWFPDLVDKFIAKGVGKKIDEDLMEYTTKDLPGIKMTKSDDGRIYVEGQNDYGRTYDMEYQPPGYEVIDEKTGKAVKTKGDFMAQEEVPVNVDPDGNADFDGEILESVDNILSSDARVMEEFATGKKIKEMKRGEFEVGKAESMVDAARKGEDFATGGRVGMLAGGGVLKTIIINLAKERGVKPSSLLEMINVKSLPKQIRDNMSAKEIKSFLEKRIEQVKNFKEMMESRLKFDKSIQQGKALDDQGTGMSDIFDFMDQSFTKGSPVPRNVDEESILQMEQMIKNMEMKDRKLNAKGGLAGQLL